LQFIIPF
jgi:hypothetical protein